MKRIILFSCRTTLLLGLLGLLGCDISLATEEEPDEVMWGNKPIRTWILDLWDEGTKQEAQTNLGQIGPDEKDLVPGLVTLLKDPDGRVRAGACRLLGQIGPNAKDAMKALDEMITDPDRLVLSECLYARKRIRNLVS